MMNDSQRLNAIKQFVADWNGRGKEKSDAHLFWLDLLTALGMKNPTQAVEFEKSIEIEEHICFIDVFMPSTKVLIEQKSRGIDLDKPARQSGDKFLTPFEQAKRYADALPRSQQPRWIVTCNFDEFRVYDIDRLPMFITDRPVEPQIIKFKHLVQEYRRLMFLVDPNDENIAEIGLNKDAVEIIAVIRKGFAKKMLAPRRFKDDEDPVQHLNPEQRDILNKFCIRLVFCLYAEDAALFKPNQFVDYLSNAADYSRALADLFKVLDTPKKQRPRELPAVLRAFEYVNGGLFADDSLVLPPFDKTVSDGITLNARNVPDKRDQKFNWFAINPTIFGALFESDLNRAVRRKGGMHYTSVENIHRVIKPLFLDALHDEFDKIRSMKNQQRRRALLKFQDKLASLTFLDPACGSGNFLTETYIQLRMLENDVLRELLNFKTLETVCTIKVTIDQFYGIEINDFACAIAQTAMWISESKMYYDTDVGIREKIKPLPLKHSARIVCDNALRLDWKKIVPDGVDYIIGNPPFVGYSFQSKEQKNDLLAATHLNNKKLDYVTGWFYKAAEFMLGTQTRAALVSTNSIVQGEQTAAVWKKLFETIHIDFAYRTFKWTSESEMQAAVHCVIVGFSHAPNDRPKLIFDGDRKIIAQNINAYLIDGADVFIESRSKPLCDVPEMIGGNRLADGGNLIIEANEYDDFIRREPRAKKFIRRLIGAEEFLKDKPRYCLWLKDATTDELKLPLIAERVEACRLDRLSGAADRQKLAATPHLFREQLNPSKCLVIPNITSERRRFIPMRFIDDNVICSNRLFLIPDAELFHFGVLTSLVHMAWMRVTAGRLEIDYSYSKTIVYNNFPWCDASAKARQHIRRTAKRILEVRGRYPERSLASLYDEATMPDDLRAAHVENDRAVMAAYEFSESLSEAEIVSRLMVMYQHLTRQAATDKFAIKRGNR